MDGREGGNRADCVTYMRRTTAIIAAGIIKCTLQREMYIASTKLSG